MAAVPSDVSSTLKKALFETLTAILSPVDDLRANAEQQINVLEVTDEFGVHLTELTLDQNAPLAVRQLASVLLRQYVESHWSSYSEKFRPPEATAEAKAAIRNLLPAGLQEPVSKVRSSVAYAISAIAHWDWPETWPQLFDILMMNLTSENCYAVHGSMRALTEVSRDVSDTQMPQVAPIILPQMLKIFTDAEKYGIRTRGRAVQIFSTCVEVIAAMSEYNKGALKTLLCPILPSFTEALVKALMVPDGPTSDSGLKKDVLDALKMMIRFIPKQMTQYLPHILTPVWNSLTENANLFIKTVVNVTEDANNPVDSDGEVLGFENLVLSIFDFVTGLVESPKCRSYIQKGITDLLYYLILYMQVTEEQVRIWTSDFDRFVEDEEEDSFSYSVRISAQDLLKLLGQDFEDETAAGLCSVVAKHIEETRKGPSNPHWWKIHEACMLALGSVQELIVSQIKNNNLQFDILRLLQSVIVDDLNTFVSPFLFGRCLMTASCYAVTMNDELVQRFLQATVSGLQQTQQPCIRISAVRAVYKFCENLRTANRSSVLLPYLSAIVDGLLPLIMQYSSEVLSLGLEALAMVLTVDESFTCSVENKVAPLTIAVFLKHNSDPVLVNIAQELFKELCRYPACHAPLQQRLLPTLVSILQAPPSKVPLGLQAVSLDVLQTVVRHSPRPLSEPLITQAFPAAAFCILHTDDNSILQNGSECLRAYVSVAMEQIASWHDENGRNGLEYIISVIEFILNPKTSESAAAFVGGLVSILVRKAGASLGEKAEQLLRAVLSKMQQAQSMSVTQNLLMVFTQLFRTQLEHVLDFLSGVPGPTGRSALEFVLTEWCNCHHMFLGSYDTKVSAFSLSKILEHSIKTNDPRLQEIEVKGDIVNFNEGIKTRSRAAQNPDQWTRIPLVVKIFKMLVQELSQLYENYNQPDEEDSSDDDIGDEENADEGISTAALNADFFDGMTCHSKRMSSARSSASSVTLSSAHRSRSHLKVVPKSAYASQQIESYDLDAEEEEYDPDMLDDPLYSMNFKTYLVEYLQKLSQLPCYSSFSQHLPAQEKTLLSNFGISS